MSSRRTCPRGHSYVKTSDCPTCPRCEAAKKPDDGVFAGLSAPACRALQSAGLTTAARLAKKREADVLALHGVGPSALPTLRASLRKAGLKFTEKRS